MLLFYLDVKAISNFENFTAILSFIFTFSISYFGISNSNTFSQLSKYELIEDPHFENEIKEQFKTSNEEEAEPVVKDYIVKQLYDKKLESNYQNLLSILIEEKPYLNENLTIEDLAKRLRVHSRYLSVVINCKFNKSFFQLINSYRVLEFNEKVLKPENRNFTFLSIALECGFGSKSAFNRAYKNEMNISPSEFLKSKTQ